MIEQVNFVFHQNGEIVDSLSD